jgi:dTMP kinase
MLIAIEGIDAVGKHTQAHLLKSKAENIGYTAEVLSFPRYGETHFAPSIASYLNGEFGALQSVDPHFPALLYAGERFESRDIITQLSESNDLLIFDRYVASNAAYQSARLKGENRRVFTDWLATIEYEIYGLPKADLTLYLDLPLETANKMLHKKRWRSYTKELADIHEQNREYLASCREVYHSLSAVSFGGPWLSINCANRDGSMRTRRQICNSIWTGILAHEVFNPQPKE